LSFAITWVHTKKLEAEPTESNLQELKEYGKKTISLWLKFHQWWIELQETLKIPVYFYRYEDVLKKPEKVYSNIFKFIMD
jgi:hypothetical protein